MENRNYNPGGDKDPHLWDIAKKRASFKGHLASYVIVNGFLWALWYFGGDHDLGDLRFSPAPWPIWPMLGWGIGLAFHYMGAYVYPKSNSAEDEYQKLLKERNKQQ